MCPVLNGVRHAGEFTALLPLKHLWSGRLNGVGTQAAGQSCVGWHRDRGMGRGRTVWGVKGLSTRVLAVLMRRTDGMQAHVGHGTVGPLVPQSPVHLKPSMIRGRQRGTGRRQGLSCASRPSLGLGCSACPASPRLREGPGGPAFGFKGVRICAQATSGESRQDEGWKVPRTVCCRPTRLSSRRQGRVTVPLDAHGFSLLPPEAYN